VTNAPIAVRGRHPFTATAICGRCGHLFVDVELLNAIGEAMERSHTVLAHA
jgi:hypothetical protein